MSQGIEKAENKETCDGKSDRERVINRLSDLEWIEEHFSPYRGLKCYACLELGDHRTSDCPHGIYKKCTVPLIQRHCKICELETSDHWTSECAHARPAKRPPRLLNLENVLLVSLLSPDETEEHLFREFNPIRASFIKIWNAERTYYDQSIAQVVFEHNEEAEKAAEKFNGYVYRGRSLHVSWVAVKGMPRFGG